MSDSAAELFKQALDLEEKDRAALAGLLLSSLEAEPDEGVEEAWRAEIARRVEELEAGTAETVTWDEVKAKLQKRIDGR
jgi:putative addiction module component (TIGR02574 family)